MEPPEVFDFPFEPYRIQHDFMKCLYKVIESKKLGIFESPTGTGKSLSIICGAIKWLKDHNNRERSYFSTQIEDLERRKQTIASNSSDWLSTQSQEIEITHQINRLKIEQNKIAEYDKKIANLNKKKGEIKKKRFVKSEPVTVMKEKDEEDDDLVLDTVNNEEPEEEEEDDNKHKPTKIFICSRTHSQLSQFVGEILKSPFASDVRVVSLASRQNYCINPNVNRLKSNSLINEKCLDIQQQIKAKTDADGKVLKKQKGDSKCPYFRQTAIEDLKDLTLTEIQDIEDLVKNGRELNACPYYSCRLAAEDAEVVLVPYNTILHKPTREANGIDLKNNVVIIDEAHNLLEAMAQMHNAELSYNQLEQGLLQLKCYKQRFSTRFSAQNLLSINQLIFVASKLQQVLDKSNENKTDTFTVEDFVLTAQIDNYNMFKLVKFCKDNRIAQKVRSYALKYPFDRSIVEKPSKKGIKDFLQTIANKSGTGIEETVEKTATFALSNPLLSIISFLESLTYSYSDGRIFVHANKDRSRMRLQFLLLNPCQNFKDIVGGARSVVVAGGTMKPVEEFKTRLFVNSGASLDRIVEFSCGHIVPQENILPIIVTKGALEERLLFTFEHRTSMGDSVTRVLQETCRTVPGGVVVFFPSYNYENWIWERIKDLSFRRPVFREPQDSGAVDAVLKAYSDAVKKGGSALLMSVVGGKLSEGLNFSDDLGRCVVVVGLPYANVAAPDLREKMAYLDEVEGVGAGRRFYEGLCMKAVNQSIGRAVRHKDDYATILLLDERYNRTATKNALPEWIKRSLEIHGFRECFERVQKFFAARNSSRK